MPTAARRPFATRFVLNLDGPLGTIYLHRGGAGNAVINAIFAVAAA
ncbi:MAG: hypothetical protein R3D55_02760 [Chloroflexota bacterium]